MLNETVYSEIMAEGLRYAGEAKIVDVAVGESVLAVETSGGIGLAFNTANAPAEMEAKIKTITEKELVSAYIGNDRVLTVFALAAINSFLLFKAKIETRNWPEIFAGKKKLAMVGNFHPIVLALREAGIEVIIFEMDGSAGTHSPDEAPELMPGCDAVMITGSTLSNRSLHTYFPYIDPDAEAFIAGPSSTLSDALLERFSIAPSSVADKDKAFEMIRAGSCIGPMSKYLNKLVLERHCPLSGGKRQSRAQGWAQSGPHGCGCPRAGV